MLPAAARIRRRADFTAAVRSGRRAGRPLLTGYLLVPGAAGGPPAAPGGPAGASGGPAGSPGPARAGFIVSRAVGGAVVRNKVRRRLRELVRGRIDSLPAGSLLVVRANPRAATARQSDLAAELDLVTKQLLRRQVGALSR